MAAKGLPIKIALADDVPSIRKTMSRMLERLGCEVICAASNGVVAGPVFRTVDGCLPTWICPLMDGLAAAQELAEWGIPVILVSGHPDAEEVVVEHEPVVWRIAKPASLASLQIAIERALVDCEKNVRRSSF
jgi:DNA-binding NtrC family response regulator